MTKEDFKARVSMAYEGREQWEAFLDRVWSIHISELPRWISVEEEGLPTKDGCYLFCAEGEPVYMCFYYADFKMSLATHWMPMPEPPAKLSNVENIGKDLKGGEQ